MGKVKVDEKVTNEVANKRRKKRKKELEVLRRNVLEAKRKLREKTAPPKTHTSSFNKILNSFADRRQANDNKTQGFDSRGKRSGLKKMCNRLLPSRKPQGGIFANGSKGAEIKRVNVSLNESARARFKGDLQKVLGDGKCKPKESTSDALNKIRDTRSAEAIDTDEKIFVRIPNEKLEPEAPAENALTENRSGKRKLQVSVNLDGKTAKKHHSEIGNMKVVVEYTEAESTEWKNSEDEKWKRRLFQDAGDDFGPITEAVVEQLRFSPRIGKTLTANPSETKVLVDATQRGRGTNKTNFGCGKIGKMGATRYKKFCEMVCAENFDNCLHEIPHIDPLQKVKQSLNNVYTETCKQKASQRKVKSKMLSTDESSSASSHPTHSHLHKNKHLSENAYHGRLKPNTAFALPPRGVCPGSDNFKNFLHREASQTSLAENNPLMTKVPEVTRRNKNIRPVTHRPLFPEAGNTEQSISSLDVNDDSSRMSLRSDILEFLKIDEAAESMVQNLNGTSSPRLAGIPTDRNKIMLRYLKDVNNPKLVKEFESIHPPEQSEISGESNDVKKFYFHDPEQRHEKQKKQNRNPPKRKSEQLRGLFPYETNTPKLTQNSFDVNCDSAGKCLGSDLREFPEIGDVARPAVVNLGSASRSTIARIPSDREGFMLRYLQDVNDRKPKAEDKKTLPTKGFIVASENNELQKRCLGDPFRRNQMENTFVDHTSKNERHVPAILRRSRATMKNKKSKVIGSALAREFGKSKSSNSSHGKLTSESETASVNNFFDIRHILRNPAPTDTPFTIHVKSSTDRVGLIENPLHNTRAAELEMPTAVNALYNRNKKNLIAKRDFMEDKFSYKLRIGQGHTVNRSEAVNSPAEFELQSSTIYPHGNASNNVGIMNFHDGRHSQNLPIFSHQQRSNQRAHNTTNDESRMMFPEDQGTHRFPVFFQRTTDLSIENGSRYEGQPGGWQYPEIGKPKVIIIQNPTAREIGEDKRREINIPNIPYKNNRQTENHNYGLTFPKFLQRVHGESRDSVYLEDGRQNAQSFQVPENTFQNVGEYHQPEKLQTRRCVCKTDTQNPLQAQLPRITHRNEIRKIVDHKHTGQELRHNPMSYLEPTTYDVSTSQRMFQHNPSSNTQIPAIYGSEYCSDANLNAIDAVQFRDRRAGFLLSKNEPESFCQNVINLPETTDQMHLYQNCSPILSRKKNRNHNYLIDPRCPQDGYQWNQIDQSGSQVHQHVIQPVYNVIDAYRPQVPHSSFFSTDC